MPNPLIKKVKIEDTDTLYDVYDESADHGGGGGGDTPFRVINEITVAEDSEAVIIDRDSNNQPFSIKELLVEIEVPAAASEIIQTLYCTIENTQWVGTGNVDFLFYYRLRTTKSLVRIHMAMHGGLVFSDAAEQPDANQEFSPQPRINTTIHALGGNIKNSGISRTTISSFSMRLQEAANIRAGTKITMYGR